MERGVFNTNNATKWYFRHGRGNRSKKLFVHMFLLAIVTNLVVNADFVLITKCASGIVFYSIVLSIISLFRAIHMRHKRRTMLRFMLDLILQVAPLEGLHKESLVDVKEQLQVLLPMLKGVIVPPTVVLLNGSFSSWLFSTLGIQVYWLLMK